MDSTIVRLREKRFTGKESFTFPDPSQTHNPYSFSSSVGEAAIDSIRGYRKGEIDGKPFFIFVFLSETETETPSSSSSSFSSSPQPLFICPSIRLRIQKSKRNTPNKTFRFETTPLFPTIGRSVDQEVQDMLNSDIHGDICKFPVVPLVHDDEDDDDDEYDYEDDDEHDDDDDDFECCDACKQEILEGAYYYICDTCGKMFHKECVESPLEIKHPSYPFLSFQLYSVRPYGLNCIVCDTSLNHNPMIYLCPTSNLGMHTVCAMKPVPIIINHPKSHLHPLTFFPKQNFLPCNVCGLIEESVPAYVCLPCVFVVHRDCIYFPSVIRMSRHHHRISFTSSLPSGRLICGVCRKEVDNHYGAYRCNKCEDYFVHSRCALRSDLWDGKELEGVPEEPEIEIEPFERIADGIISHFSHEDHYLKLESFEVYDQDKFCQACVLPIYQGNYYSCINECDFILHETCASLPRKKYHAFHRHQLTLVTSNDVIDKLVTSKVIDAIFSRVKGCFTCRACERISCGFVYECVERRCGFQLDVRCASVSEPFEYQGHEHPLFLALTPEEEQSASCYICCRSNSLTQFFRRGMLNCIECKDIIICLTCATLPYKARYKHDIHFLTFRERKDGSDQLDWCDVCEGKVMHSKEGGFYSCDDCCTTLHVDCLFGKQPYMKPGHTIEFFNEEFQILPNNTQSRPFCRVHDKARCQDRIVFKKEDMMLCSYGCYIGTRPI
ncbi:unnamed protein product [Microthlaspi erraticum]|uniref:Zinc finger PHD-type domain-containing protein n=1 Tax=Microthlaspi erraticum TaxID=1685480 RepID=A0A6D2L9V9_9BRAS|nr:unnamed protein product [Microthlaspi erraticum]